MEIAEYLLPVLFFGLKAFIVVVSFLFCVIVPLLVIKRLSLGDRQKARMDIEDLKKKQGNYIQGFKKKALNKKEFKKFVKQVSMDKKQNTLFVLSFTGDIMASQVKNLKEEISLLLQVAESKDEVVLLLESRGGAVSHYGLAASQLQRLRDKNIPLTICVDKIAGSGGYLMACVGNQILASPFAFIGSIGVMFGLPNVHDFLKKHSVHYEEVTAGEFKTTITPFGQVTDQKRQRLKHQLELIHSQFKNFVKRYRNIDLKQTATGEAWLAEEALKKGLVDKLQCADDYILEKMKTHNVYKISLKSPKTVLEKLLGDKQSFFQKQAFGYLKNDLFI